MGLALNLCIFCLRLQNVLKKFLRKFCLRQMKLIKFLINIPVSRKVSSVVL